MKTNKLPNTASKQERREAHRVKMRAKKIFREKLYEQFSGATYIPANLGINHPDYGMTVSQHFAEKAKRG